MVISDGSNSYRVELAAPPLDYDLAFAFMRSKKGDQAAIYESALNQSVLAVYGTSFYGRVPKPDADVSYFSLGNPEGKTALCVVFEANKFAQAATAKNLMDAINDHIPELIGKKVWIPLFGENVDTFNAEKNYRFLIDTLKKTVLLSMSADVVISFPRFPSAVALYEKMLKENKPGNPDEADPKKDPETVKQSDPKEAADFLEGFKGNFYLANFDPYGENLRTWIRGEITWSDDYGNDVGRVAVGDVIVVQDGPMQQKLFNQSAAYVQETSIGIVTGNPADASPLDVRWTFDKGLLIVLTAARGTEIIPVVKINSADFVPILTQIDKSLWKYILYGQSDRTINLASIQSDSDTGPDYLDITKDVSAFAHVIAAKTFEPPMAIALLGKWGSGKSFFMRMLKTEINKLTGNNSAYCNQIVHIHFNAWSYIDANLWASIVVQIFEKLNEHISQMTIPEVMKKELEKDLSQQLNITKTQMSLLENKKTALTQQIDYLEEQKKILKEALRKKINRIRKNSLWEVIKNADEKFEAQKKITDALTSNSSFNHTQEELKEIVPEKYWNHPKAAYEEVKSTASFLKEFFGRKWTWNLLAFAVIIILIIGLPFLISRVAGALSIADFRLHPAVLSFFITISAIWARAQATYKKMQPLIASFWTIKNDYDNEMQKAISAHEQEEKALKISIEKDRAEIIIIDRQIQEASAQKADLEFKMNNALSTEVLFSFIEKRTQSEDYKKHLGIISTIRRDFEILSGLFTEHHTELAKNEKVAEFRAKYKNRLERIILYIDDLDRCPEENVVQVLEAVNLLMAYPLFVVVVGVDPRWVKNALLKKHTLQFGHNDYGNGFETIEPSDYLEKIFQIPFHLKDASKPSVDAMIRSLAERKPAPLITEDEAAKKPEPEIVKTTQDFTAAESEHAGEEKPETENEMPIETETTAQPEKDSKPVDVLKAVEISEKEIIMLQDTAEIVGNNPRAIKRFLNTYRIVKAHEDFIQDDREPGDSELLTMMFLLALPIGIYKSLTKPFEECINDESRNTKPLSSFLLAEKTDPHAYLKHQLDVLLSDRKNYQTLQREPLSTFHQYNSFIKRFTFKSM